VTEVKTRYPEPSRHAGKCLRTSPAGLTIRSGNLRTALEPTSPRVGFRRPAAQLICGALVRWRANPSERSCCSVLKPQPQWPHVRSSPWTPCSSRSIPGTPTGHTERDYPRHGSTEAVEGTRTTSCRRISRLPHCCTSPTGSDSGACDPRHTPSRSGPWPVFTAAITEASWSMLRSCR